MKTRIATIFLAALAALGLVWFFGNASTELETGNAPIAVKITASGDETDSSARTPGQPAQQKEANEQSARKAHSPTANYGPREIMSPYAVVSVMPSKSLDDIRDKFEDHYEEAQNGDADAMLMMFYIARNCSPIGSIGSEEQLEAELVKLNLPAMYAGTARKLFPDCSYVNSHVPETTTPEEWGRQFLNDAAEAGNLLAKLELTMNLTPEEQTYKETASMLEDAVRTNDYRAFYLVSDFYARYHVREGFPENELEYYKWNYLACVHHSACNEEAMRHNLTVQLLPWQVNEIMVAAENIEKRLADPTPFHFDRGRLPHDTD